MKTILNVETNEPIPYSYRKITYRKFRKAVDMLEDSRSAKRDESNKLVEDAANILIDGATLLMDGASNVDVQFVMTSAIEFNQTSEADAKKSELQP